jgi:ribosome-interacting GTPase 1
MKYKGANIQVLDLPGLISGASKGKGRGKEILSAIRNVNLILFMIDANNIDSIYLMIKELNDSGIRLNQNKPDVVVKKTGQGGINVTSTVILTKLDEDLIKTISSEYVINADIIIREDISEDQLIDVFIQNRVYVPAILIINKTDLISREELNHKIRRLKEEDWKTIGISALEGIGLIELQEMIFSELKLIRIYMKPVGKKTDYNEPMILRSGDTVEEVCKKLHRDFKNKFRYASVTGPSAKHKIQKVGLDHKLKDEDVLTIVVSH